MGPAMDILTLKQYRLNPFTFLDGHTERGARRTQDLSQLP